MKRVLARLLPRGLRTRLTLAILLITGVVVALSFVAIDRQTGADLQQRIDNSLRDDFSEFGGPDR